MDKLANVRKYKILEKVISSMCLGLDEKSCIFYVNYFIIIHFVTF